MHGATSEDLTDLAKPGTESAYAAFVSHCVARYLIHSHLSLRREYLSPPHLVLRTIVQSFLASDEEARELFGQNFFSNLFETYPEIQDYFLHTDLDWLAVTHATRATSMIFQGVDGMLQETGPWRKECLRLDRFHKVHSIPTNLYQIFGANYLLLLSPLFAEEALARQFGDFPVTQEELEDAFSSLYVDAACEVSPAMMYEEMVLKGAEKLLATISNNLQWPEEELCKRVLQIKLELSRGNVYTLTTEELKAGARIAWRTSAKDAVRKAWTKLDVLDRRDVDTHKGICQLIDEHLQAAVSNANVLAVLSPKRADEVWGFRFWSPKYFLYAGYKKGNGTMVGDPANIEFTNHLVKYGIWKPPKEQKDFDLLPIVFKVPGLRPFAYKIPDDLKCEVAIEHPECKAVADLGLRWPAFDFSSNVSMVIGGIRYQCCCFNQEHVSTEVVQNLSKRPGLVQRFAKAMKIPPSQTLFKKKIQYEMELAVLHSFKSQGYAIMDSEEAAISFSTHCNREREAGRECLQESMLGSLSDCHRTLPHFGFGCDEWNVSAVSMDITAEQVSQENEAIRNQKTREPNILILYGSETGTSENVAYRLRRALKLLKPTVMDINSAAGLEVVEEKGITHIIVICSTFNRGEFPQNARKIAEAVHAPDVLDGKQYAVLALGSSLYPDFCAAGCRVDQILQCMGAKSCLPLTKVDAKHGLEGQIADWLKLAESILLPKHLLAAVQEGPVQYKMKWQTNNTTNTGSLDKFSWPKTTKNETMLCIANEELMVAGDIDTRSTRRLTFHLPPGVSYESGDHLSIQPLNSLDMVRRFALCFKAELMKDADCRPGELDENVFLRQLLRPFSIECFEGEESVEAQLPFDTPTTLSDLLQAHTDLTLHDFKIVELLALVHNASYDTNGQLKQNLADEHKEEMQQIEAFHRKLTLEVVSDEEQSQKQSHINSFMSLYPTMVAFLEGFPFLGSLLGLANVLQVLPRLQPRCYSISSSPKRDASSVSISVGVVLLTTSAGVKIRGVCSNYLARICPHDCVKVSVRTSSFRGPKDHTSPVIMVGPGTGLAPLMGFLEDRAIGLAANPELRPADCHLFFGCRTNEDFLYRNQITTWEAANTLKLHLALSRCKSAPKKYVQDLMKGMGQQLYELLVHPDTHIYLCGDAKVGNAAFELCLETLRVHGHMSRVTAANRVKIMKTENRWQYDLWGTVKSFDDIGALKIKKQEENMNRRAKLWLKSVE